MNTKMSPSEIYKVALYQSARVTGATVAEAQHAWELYPAHTFDSSFSMAGYEGLTFPEAIEKCERDIRKSPYYDARQDRIVPVTGTREYI